MILAVVFPPLAVIDKGCGVYLIAFALTFLGWIPGVIYAFAYFWWEKRHPDNGGSQVSKLQSKESASNSKKRSNSSGNSGNDSWDSPQQSPYNRPRRMSNQQQNNNNQPRGWQGW